MKPEGPCGAVVELPRQKAWQNGPDETFNGQFGDEYLSVGVMPHARREASTTTTSGLIRVSTHRTPNEQYGQHPSVARIVGATYLSDRRHGATFAQASPSMNSLSGAGAADYLARSVQAARSDAILMSPQPAPQSILDIAYPPWRRGLQCREASSAWPVRCISRGLLQCLRAGPSNIFRIGL